MSVSGRRGDFIDSLGATVLQSENHDKIVKW